MAKVQQVQNGVAAVGYQYQGSPGQPAPELQNHLAGPIGELFVPLPPFPVKPLRRCQHRQERQGPDPAGPRNGGQPHQTNPAQPAGFYEMALAGTDPISVNAFGRNPLPPGGVLWSRQSQTPAAQFQSPGGAAAEKARSGSIAMMTTWPD